jgi:hypothetical protein
MREQSHKMLDGKWPRNGDVAIMYAADKLRAIDCCATAPCLLSQ